MYSMSTCTWITALYFTHFKCTQRVKGEPKELRSCSGCYKMPLPLECSVMTWTSVSFSW